MPCQRRVRGRGSCGARRPRDPEVGRLNTRGPGESRFVSPEAPASESEFLCVAALLPTPHLAPCSPFPPKPSATDLSGSPPPCPLLLRVSLEGGGGGAGGEVVCESPRLKPRGKGWGWGRGVRDLFTRKSQGRAPQLPRPRPGCIVLARAPCARGGPGPGAVAGRLRAALCSGRSRAQRSSAELSAGPRARTLLSGLGDRCLPSERAGRRGTAAWKSNRGRPVSFLPKQ